MKTSGLLAALAVSIAACAGRGAAHHAALSRCPSGSIAADDGVCRCRAGRFAAGPACVSFREASLYCGPGATMEPGGTCAMRACRADDVLDVDASECVSSASLPGASSRATADGPRRAFACATGASLVVESQELRCLPASAMCARGWRWSAAENRCARARACAAGEVVDMARDRCVRVVTPEGERDVVDVGTWIAVTIGPYGGAGTSDFCAALARTPGRFGRASADMLRIDIGIDFPANDVHAARTRFRAAFDSASAVLTGQAERAVERTLASLVDSLRAIGGDASSSTVETSVVCSVGEQGAPLEAR